MTCDGGGGAAQTISVSHLYLILQRYFTDLIIFLGFWEGSYFNYILKRDSKPRTLTSHPTLCATIVAETAMLGLD